MGWGAGGRPEGGAGHEAEALGRAAWGAVVMIPSWGTHPVKAQPGSGRPRAQLPGPPLRPPPPAGLSWEECRQRCPPGVVPACHNSKDTVTISGPQVGPGAASPAPAPSVPASSAWGPAQPRHQQPLPAPLPQAAVAEFVAQLKQEDVFAKEVRTGGLAFHSYFMQDVAPSLLQTLKKVGPRPTGPPGHRACPTGPPGHRARPA